MTCTGYSDCGGKGQTRVVYHLSYCISFLVYLSIDKLPQNMRSCDERTNLCFFRRNTVEHDSGMSKSRDIHIVMVSLLLMRLLPRDR